MGFFYSNKCTRRRESSPQGFTVGLGQSFWGMQFWGVCAKFSDAELSVSEHVVCISGQLMVDRVDPTAPYLTVSTFSTLFIWFCCSVLFIEETFWMHSVFCFFEKSSVMRRGCIDRCQRPDFRCRVMPLWLNGGQTSIDHCLVCIFDLGEWSVVSVCV